MQKTVLVVEDEDPLRRVLSERLQVEGFETLEAADGEMALEIAFGKRPHLILLDVMMPKENGFSVLKKLRDDEPYGKQVPIIMLTNMSVDDPLVAEAIDRYEPTFYLVKVDNSLSHIVDKVHEALMP